ncbi:MAG: thioredoxin family protein [Bacteroidaceae bacterium]|nr:thioredoxin family protein [Bacteroidaceae bacterium]
MKRLITITLSLLTFITTMAQGIAFEPDGTTLEQASAKAKAEGKLIFLDCFTTWCGPCRKMALTVFTQEKVGSAMNPKFVSVKIDMESQYGAPLAKKLQVTAYPTFVIFNADLQEIGRFLGGSEADEFLKRVKEKSSDNSSGTLKERWDAGERDPQFLLAYLKTLTATYKTQDANDVAEALLAGKEETFAGDSTLRRIFLSNINNPFAKSFIYTAKNPDALASYIGARGVEAKITNVLAGYQRQLIIEKDGGVNLDKAQFDAFLSLLAELKTKEADHYRLSTLITLSEKQKDLKSYIGYIKEYLDNKSLDASDMQLAQWTKPFSAPDADPKLKAEIKKILQKRIKDIESGKRKAQTQVGNMRLSRPTDELLRMIVDALDGKMPQR